MAPRSVKISVLLAASEAKRFASYCSLKGYKKSSLIARLVREHLDHENYHLNQAPARAGRARTSHKS
jgi:hypothetical protein